MTTLQIAVLIVLAFIAGRLSRGRQLVMLGISAWAVFWLQSAEPFVTLRFWMPVATLGLCVVAWTLTGNSEMRRGAARNWPAALVLLGVVGAMAIGRYLPFGSVLPTVAPPLPMLIAAVISISAAAFVFVRWRAAQGFLRFAAVMAVIAIFVALKSPDINEWISVRLAGLRGESPAGAAAPLTWLGFSYLAFRILHTIRDRQTGRLPAVSLAEYMNYAIFFPAFTSGPIDRLERFVKDLREPLPLCDEDWIYAGRRLALGLFKKFVIADLLAVISINDALVARVHAAGWLWVFLYAYAFRIYFDFSGYTDLAIGLARLMGVRLPENFAAPYLKPNITQFWNSWHITLTQWFRAYVFNPLTRTLRSIERDYPVWLIILAAQLTTMVLIGLWHGIAWGFAIWGLWHAAGLFFHNRWGEIIRDRMPAWVETPGGRKAMSAAGIFLTFNYVALGWLFFTLSSPSVAWLALRKLFGFA